MVTRAQTQANYGRLSRWYDLLAGSSERKYCELGLRMLDVRSGERVLETGSGPTGSAVGMDLSGGCAGLPGGG